ncbi:hypothetical protein GW17_00055919 [Ensete ventricosum]|nr:hypothetical protein GW17_00055919 [Ensete ventricosum]
MPVDGAKEDEKETNQMAARPVPAISGLPFHLSAGLPFLLTQADDGKGARDSRKRRWKRETPSASFPKPKVPFFIRGLELFYSFFYETDDGRVNRPISTDLPFSLFLRIEFSFSFVLRGFVVSTRRKSPFICHTHLYQLVRPSKASIFEISEQGTASFDSEGVEKGEEDRTRC